jgi:tagaturonate reductase
VEANGKLPEHLAFSIASMMSLYRGGKIGEDGKLHCVRDGQPYELQDDAAVLQFFSDTSSLSAAEQVHAFLTNEAFFGQDLTQIPGLEKFVADALQEILDQGMKATVLRRFPA